MRGPAAGRRVALPQHVRHPGAQERRVAVRPGVPRRRYSPQRLHPDGGFDAGQFLRVPALVAARPAERHHSVHRPGVPGPAQSGQSAEHPQRIVRHLRTPGRKTGPQNRELPLDGPHRRHRLLQPQQPGVDMPDRRRTAHPRRTGHALRHGGHRRPRLPLHGLPQSRWGVRSSRPTKPPWRAIRTTISC